MNQALKMVYATIVYLTSLPIIYWTFFPKKGLNSNILAKSFFCTAKVTTIHGNTNGSN